MSTNIHNGYILPAISSFKLQQIVNDLRVKLLNIKNRLVYEAISYKAVEVYDNLTAFNMKKNLFISSMLLTEDVDRHYYYNKKKIIENPIIDNSIKFVSDSYNHIHKTRRRNPSYDFQFTACFIATKNKTYVLIFTEQKDYIEAFENIKEVMPYPYWDSTDGPKDMTDKQWSARGKEWFKILDYRGLNFELLNDEEYFRPYDEDIDFSKYFPTYEYRLNKYAKRHAVDELYKAVRKETAYDNTDNFMSEYINVNSYVTRTDAGELLIEKKKKLISKIIKPILSIDDLKLSYNQIKNKEVSHVA